MVEGRLFQVMFDVGNCAVPLVPSLLFYASISCGSSGEDARVNKGRRKSPSHRPLAHRRRCAPSDTANAGRCARRAMAADAGLRYPRPKCLHYRNCISSPLVAHLHLLLVGPVVAVLSFPSRVIPCYLRESLPITGLGVFLRPAPSLPSFKHQTQLYIIRLENT